MHRSIHDDFVSHFVRKAKDYVLGDPRDPATTLGPVISLQSAARIRQQVADAGKLTRLESHTETFAVNQGAELVLSENEFAGAAEGSTCMGPMVLTNVDHSEFTMTCTLVPGLMVRHVNHD